MFLSKSGYSELVQRIFEKITFFRVDPLSKAVVSAARAVDGILDVRFLFFGYDNMLSILW